MSDFAKDLFDTRRQTGGDPKEFRRRVIRWLAATLTEMAGADWTRTGEMHKKLILDLTAVITKMTDRIAEADEATFSAIVGEAQMLVQTLLRRKAEEARVTLH